jgi:hypothetical protein
MVRLPPLDFIGRFGQQKVASCRSFVCPKRQIIKEMEVVYLSTPLFALCLSVTYARLLATHALPPVAIARQIRTSTSSWLLQTNGHGSVTSDLSRSGERLRAYGRGQPLVAECRFSFSVQSEAMVILQMKKKR